MSLWLDLRIMLATILYVLAVPASWIAAIFGFPKPLHPRVTQSGHFAGARSGDALAVAAGSEA